MTEFEPKGLIREGQLDDSRKALLAQCIKLVILSTCLALAHSLLTRSDLTLGAYLMSFGPFLLSYGLALRLVMQGWFNVGAWLFMVGTLVGQLGVVLIAHDYVSQALVSLVNLVLISAFTMGSGVAAGVTLVCVVIVCVHPFLDLGLIHQASLIKPEPASQAAALAATLFTTGGLVIIGMRHFRAGMDRLEAASNSAVRLRKIAEEARTESIARARASQSLAELGAGLIELRSASAVASLCCRALFHTFRVKQVLLLDENDFCVGGHPDVLRRRPNQSFALRLEKSRPLSPDECKALEITYAEFKAGYGYAQPIETPFARRTLILLDDQPFKPSETEIAYLKTTGELLAAGVGRVLAEERLVRSQKMDVVDRLSAGIAHDLNNYLMAIVTGLEIIELKLQRGQSADSHLALVRRSSESASALMRKLTNFTQARHQKPEPVNIAQVVSNLPNVLTHRPEKRVRYNLSLPRDVLWVLADPVDIEQIVLNLLLNAFDAIHEEGQITLAVTRRESKVILTVEDDGHGMSDNVKHRIFEPFFTTKDHGGGTGLGLTMVFGLVRASRAEIDVVTTPNKGTRFEIAFPLHLPECNFEQTISEATRIGDPRRILVVDDDPLVRSMLVDSLTELNYSVTEACDGTEAWRILNSVPLFDLVLTDVVMPGMRGYTLIEHMRQNNLHIPTVVMTGYAPNALTEGVNLEALPALNKPFTTDSLNSALESAIAAHSKHLSADHLSPDKLYPATH